MIYANRNQLWAIAPGSKRTLEAAIANLSSASNLRADDDSKGMWCVSRTPMYVDPNGIAHIELRDILAGGMPQAWELLGNTDYETVSEELETLIEGGARGLFLEVSSGGGAMSGNSEIADMLQLLSRKIPTVAFSCDLAGSAAYNIAVSCRKFFCTPSAIVGSVGTIIAWVDEAGAFEMEGLKWDPIVSGPLKGAMSGPTLTDAQRESLQQLVDDGAALFKANVLRNRRIADEYLQGQALLGPRALAANLVDGLLTESEAYSFLMKLVQ
jgi:ClpP class serine protease